MKLWSRVVTTACILTLVFLTVPSAANAEDEEPTWHLTFNGHEMWQTDLSEALKQSNRENKFVIIDIFSPH